MATNEEEEVDVSEKKLSLLEQKKKFQLNLLQKMSSFERRKELKKIKDQLERLEGKIGCCGSMSIILALLCIITGVMYFCIQNDIGKINGTIEAILRPIMINSYPHWFVPIQQASVAEQKIIIHGNQNVQINLVITAIIFGTMGWYLGKQSKNGKISFPETFFPTNDKEKMQPEIEDKTSDKIVSSIITNNLISEQQESESSEEQVEEQKTSRVPNDSKNDVKTNFNLGEEINTMPQLSFEDQVNVAKADFVESVEHLKEYFFHTEATVNCLSPETIMECDKFSQAFEKDDFQKPIFSSKPALKNVAEFTNYNTNARMPTGEKHHIPETCFNIAHKLKEYLSITEDDMQVEPYETLPPLYVLDENNNHRYIENEILAETLFGTGKPLIIFAIDDGVNAFVEITKSMTYKEPFLCYMTYENQSPDYETVLKLETLENEEKIPALFVQFPGEEVKLGDVLRDHSSALENLLVEEDASVLLFTTSEREQSLYEHIFQVFPSHVISDLKFVNRFTAIYITQKYDNDEYHNVNNF